MQPAPLLLQERCKQQQEQHQTQNPLQQSNRIQVQWEQPEQGIVVMRGAGGKRYRQEVAK
jgi:hypothetical protein